MVNEWKLGGHEHMEPPLREGGIFLKFEGKLSPTADFKIPREVGEGGSKGDDALLMEGVRASRPRCHI